MRLTLSSKYKHGQSFSSKSGRGNSNRGISVTLSKQKQTNSCSQNKYQRSSLSIHQSSFENKQLCCSQNNNMNIMSNLFNQITLQSNTQKCQQNIFKYQQNIFRDQQNHLNKDQQNHIIKEQQTRKDQDSLKTKQQKIKQNKLPKSNMIGVYFMTTQQKLQAKKQSEKLDQHIKKLQLQIYNTRSKITQTKYLQHHKNTNFKSNHHYSQTQQIINPNQNNLSLINYQTQFNSHNKSNQTLAQINQKSSKPKIIKLSKNKKLPISPSSTNPPHPILLRQMLTSQKQKTIKNPHLSQNLSNKIQKSHPLNSQYQNQSNKNSKNQKTNKKTNINLSDKHLNLLDPLSNKYQVLNSNKNNRSISKNNQQSFRVNKNVAINNQFKSNKKRSFSVNLQDNIIKNNKKSLNLSEYDKKKFFKQKQKSSKMQFKIQNYLSLYDKQHKKTASSSNKIQKTDKNNKKIFTDEMLTKKVSSKKKKKKQK